MTQHNLLQELEDDIERQRLEDLWRRVGPYVITLAVVIMLVTGAYSVWHSWRTEKVQNATAQFITLAAQSTTDDAATLASLEKFAQENPATAQGTFALFEAAAIAVKQGDKSKALSYYNSIASSTKNDEAFRQLAAIYAIQIQMDDGDVAGLLKGLEPLMAQDGVFRSTALELSGYLNLKLGNKEKARQVFSALANDSAVPRSINERSTHMLRYLSY